MSNRVVEMPDLPPGAGVLFTSAAGSVLSAIRLLMLGPQAWQRLAFVIPAADPIVAGVDNEVRKAAEILVVTRLQPIVPDDLHGALLAPIRQEP